MTDLDQKGGRGGRDNKSECVVLLLAEPWAIGGDPERIRTGCKKEMRTEVGVFRYVTTRLCRREFLAVSNDDQTSTGKQNPFDFSSTGLTSFTLALDFTNNFCCDSDQHEVGFDINRYFLAPVLLPAGSSTSGATLSPAVPKPPRTKYRSVPDRKGLGLRLTNWRESLHSSLPLLRQWPIGWILDDNDIVLLARARPGHFAVSSDITEFLGESEEWGQHRALDIFSIILGYDRELSSARAIATAKKKAENKTRAAEKRNEKRQAKLAGMAAAAAEVEEGVDPESEGEQGDKEAAEETPGTQSEEEPESDNALEVQPNDKHLHVRSGAVTRSQAARFLVYHDPSPTSSRASSPSVASRPPTPSTAVTAIAHRRPRPPHSPAAQPKTPPPPSKRQRTRLDDTTNTYELRSRR